MNDAFCLLMVAVGATLLLVPAHGAAQGTLPVSCGDLYSRSPLEDLLPCAIRGHAEAQSSLGLKYARGAGVAVDHVEAVRWYRLAAEQGHAESQWLLGGMYDVGDGVTEDDVVAYMWFNLSGAQGHVSAQESQDIIELRMTRAQITQARGLFREWMQMHP